MHGALKRRALMHGAHPERRAPMNILKMSAVHGQNFFFCQTKASGVQTTVQGRGEGCFEPDATTKMTIFRVQCSFTDAG